jgi:hypothetical protein
MMSKVKVRIQSVVCVTVEGYRVSKDPRRVLEDDGLVSKMLRFMLDQGIYSAVHCGMSGAGRHVGFYTAEDAEKIETWLRQQVIKPRKK